jgi:site-specific recombinase XerC
MAIASRSNSQISYPILSELLGQSDFSTTMVYTHVLNRGPAGVRSAADRHIGLAAEAHR